jgi:SH3 domain protein
MLKATIPTIALVVCAVASAETAYVTDSLRLGIHEAADTSDQPFVNVVSGTAVEVLERNGSYARVRLDDGREGWARATFLVATKPAAARIAELEAKVVELESAAAAAKAAQTTAEQELGRLTNQVESSTGSTQATEDTLEQLKTENRAYEERFETYRSALPVRWVVPALVLTLVGGFLAGLWWLDALIRRRHGGFRVY